MVGAVSDFPSSHTELCLGNTYIGFWTSHSQIFVAYNMKHCLIEGPIIPIYFQSQPEQVIFESLCWGPSKNHIICNTKVSLCSHLEIQIKCNLVIHLQSQTMSSLTCWIMQQVSLLVPSKCSGVQGQLTTSHQQHFISSSGPILYNIASYRYEDQCSIILIKLQLPLDWIPRAF